MINNVVLTGRLVNDVDLKYTEQGNAVGSFRLAINRNYTNQSGEREADFITCVIWRKKSETLAQYTSKGSLIGVVGRIQTRSYENQSGQRVYVTEVLVEDFSLLESRNERSNENQNNTKSDDSTPETPAHDYGIKDYESSTVDLSDDDLPF